MHTYTCDYCKMRIIDVAYVLKTLFIDSGMKHRDQHFHWDCLKLYVVRLVKAESDEATDT